MIDPDWIVRRMIAATVTIVLAMLVVGAAVACALLRGQP